MSSKSILVAALAVAGTLAWQAVSAQASAPVTREQRKAETAAANKSGQLTPAGQGGAPQTKSTAPVDQDARPSARPRPRRRTSRVSSRRQDKAARRRRSRPPPARPCRVTERKAETAEANKAGQLTPAGQGGAPQK